MAPFLEVRKIEKNAPFLQNSKNFTKIENKVNIKTSKIGIFAEN